MTQCLYCVLSLDLQWQPVAVSLCGKSCDITVAGVHTRAVVRLERETEVLPDGATAHPIWHNVLTRADEKGSLDEEIAFAQIYVLVEQCCYALQCFNSLLILYAKDNPRIHCDKLSDKLNSNGGKERNVCCIYIYLYSSFNTEKYH